MRHRYAGKKLNRSSKHRQALFKNLIAALVVHGQIETTLAKARAVAPQTDKLITIAKKGDLSARKRLHAVFNRKAVTNTLVDIIAPQLSDRDSGYTRLVRLRYRRGDAAPLVRLEFTDTIVYQEPQIKKEKSPKKTQKSAPKSSTKSKKASK